MLVTDLLNKKLLKVVVTKTTLVKCAVKLIYYALLESKKENDTILVIQVITDYFFRDVHSNYKANCYALWCENTNLEWFKKLGRLYLAF